MSLAFNDVKFVSPVSLIEVKSLPETSIVARLVAPDTSSVVISLPVKLNEVAVVLFAILRVRSSEKLLSPVKFEICRPDRSSVLTLLMLASSTVPLTVPVSYPRSINFCSKIESLIVTVVVAEAAIGLTTTKDPVTRPAMAVVRTSFLKNDIPCVYHHNRQNTMCVD